MGVCREGVITRKKSNKQEYRMSKILYRVQSDTAQPQCSPPSPTPAGVIIVIGPGVRTPGPGLPLVHSPSPGEGQPRCHWTIKTLPADWWGRGIINKGVTNMTRSGGERRENKERSDEEEMMRRRMMTGR